MTTIALSVRQDQTLTTTKLTTRDVFCIWLADQGKLTRTVCEAAVWHGLRQDNPTAGLKAPKDKTERSERIKFLPLDALRRILSPWPEGRWATSGECVGHRGTVRLGVIPQDLSGAAAPQLSFWDRYTLAAYDHGYVEVSTDGGQTWTALLDHYCSSEGTWTERLVDLSSYAGQQVGLRFRLDARNHTNVADGWTIDDLAIEDGGTPTATPTATSTVTPTATSTLTPTTTSTVTPTATSTVTPTLTATPTGTTTPTPTATITETATATPTATGAPTATETPTPTETATSEPTATPTATEVPTATETPTEEPAPTETLTEVPTDTPTATDTPTEVPTDTATPEPTATETPVPTATDTDTPEATPTEEPTPTATATETAYLGSGHVLAAPLMALPELVPALAPLGAPLTTTHRVISYTYDALYRLTGADYSTGESFAYTYDPVGNRLSLTTTAAVVNYAYDAANRLTSVNGQAYTWDDNGNLLNDGLRSYSYDHANRLTQVVSGTLTTEFTYNGAGDRVAKTVDGVTTDYVLDPAAGLTQVLQETTGGQQTAYLYGADLLAQYDSGTWAYHVNDGLGSVRQLVDPTGQVVASYSFDPFGVPLGDSGGEPYGFTGEQWDASAGLVFLRARYYEPGMGRFISKDPLSGIPQLPQSFHGWSYADGNPVLYTDPTGCYDCLTSPQQWPEKLLGLCLLLQNDLTFRLDFYQKVIIGWSSYGKGYKDAAQLLQHYLDKTGEDVYLGARMVGLIERDVAPTTDHWLRTRYLPTAAARTMGLSVSESESLPKQVWREFLTNDPDTPGIRVSEPVWLALGGFYLKIDHLGTVRRGQDNRYLITLKKDFSMEKEYNFAPNVPGVENNPAPFDVPGFGTVYFPDEWAYELELEGYAKSFTVFGEWSRTEEIVITDPNCDGNWADGEIESRNTMYLRLPTQEGISTSASHRTISIFVPQFGFE